MVPLVVQMPLMTQLVINPVGIHVHLEELYLAHLAAHQVPMEHIVHNHVGITVQVEELYLVLGAIQVIIVVSADCQNSIQIMNHHLS